MAPLAPATGAVQRLLASGSEVSRTQSPRWPARAWVDPHSGVCQQHHLPAPQRSSWGPKAPDFSNVPGAAPAAMQMIGRMAAMLFYPCVGALALLPCGQKSKLK